MQTKAKMDRQAFIQKLEQLSRKQKILIVCGSIILLLVAYWYLFFLPGHNTLKELEAENKSLDKTISGLRKKVSRLPALEKEYAALQRELTQARTLLPKSNQGVENLLSAIEALGNQVGIEFLHFAPGAENIREYYAARLVDLKISGPYHNLMGFFSRLSRLNRLVTLETLQLQPVSHGQKETELSAGCTISIYRSLSPAELAAKKKK
ncbi:MAG: type 4a pilus biogenesis protein PilO [Desulfohalobiaceae bacterium]|nr:type 4a pilus biogenesis protein PilO [Desulfohalobiaceae bacterium]